MTRLARAAILATAVFSIAWLNPERDQVATGNQSYDAGKYDAAITAYGQALVDDPDSPLLNFNMGTASYKAAKYTEAMASFGRVGTGDAVTDRAARTAYNTGNVYYRLGVAAEAEKPQDALTAYANALVAYRRAIGLNSADADAKFNYEFVTKKIDDLKKKLEEQQQQQKDKQQQQDQQQQDQQKQDEQKQDEQQQDQQPQDQQQDGDQQQQQADKSQDEKEQEQQQAAQDQAQKDGEQQEAQPAGGDQEDDKGQQAGATEGEPREGMSPQEAAALIDTARGDEVQPDEFIRRLQGTGVAEPAQDW